MANLIQIINYLNNNVENINEFITKKIDPNIDDLIGFKEGYAQLKWMEKNISALYKKIQESKCNYEEKFFPLVDKFNEISFDIDEKTKYETQKINILDDDWGELIVESENMKYIEHMINKPLTNNELKKIVDNPYRKCIGTNNISCDMSQGASDGAPYVTNIPNGGRDIPNTQNPNKINNSNLSAPNNRIYRFKQGEATIFIPIINKLSDIPNNLYYFIGDDKNKMGIYMRVSNNCVAQIPTDIEVIPSNSDMRKRIIKCNNSKNCQRWDCVYQHPGGAYYKLGCVAKCPSVPNFSNQESLMHDINKITYEDIRKCIMYSSTDLLSIFTWFQKKERTYKDKNGYDSELIVLNNLNICDDYEDILQ